MRLLHVTPRWEFDPRIEGLSHTLVHLFWSALTVAHLHGGAVLTAPGESVVDRVHLHFRRGGDTLEQTRDGLHTLAAVGLIELDEGANHLAFPAWRRYNGDDVGHESSPQLSLALEGLAPATASPPRGTSRRAHPAPAKAPPNVGNTLRSDRYYFRKRARRFQTVPTEMSWADYLATPDGMALAAQRGDAWLTRARWARERGDTARASNANPPALMHPRADVAAEAMTLTADVADRCGDVAAALRNVAPTVSATPATVSLARVGVSETSVSLGDSAELSQPSSSSSQRATEASRSVAPTVAATSVAKRNGEEVVEGPQQKPPDARTTNEPLRCPSEEACGAPTIAQLTIAPDLAVNLLQQLAPGQLQGGHDPRLQVELRDVFVAVGQLRGEPVDETAWRTFCDWLRRGDRGKPALGYRRVPPRVRELLKLGQFDEWLDAALLWSRAHHAKTAPPMPLVATPVARRERSAEEAAAVAAMFAERKRLTPGPRIAHPSVKEGTADPNSLKEAV